MAIVGFTFMKFSVEKRPLISKQVKINNDLQLGSLELVKRAEQGADVLKFNFTYKVSYGDMGDIDLAGYLLYADSLERLNKLLETWQKDKMIPVILLQQVLNAILIKCNIKSLELAQDVGLPPHFELPKLNVNIPKQPSKKEKK
ncbi:MAG: hypothetical protein WC595_04480 [Candidatus Nanoarchaeia archaeon]